MLPEEKFYINLAETGNTVSSTVLIALKDCLANETIKPGMNVMIAGFGVGLSWGATLLKF
jgi:3-oxoacyl-[acyl-carrier-protein] synthase-3